MMKEQSKFRLTPEMVQIVPAQKMDLPELVKLERQCFSDPWSLSCFEAAQKYSYSTMLLAKLGDTVAGYCCLYHIMDEGEIVNIAVAPDFCRAGIGTKMLASLLEKGRGQGVTRFLLDVRFSNLAAIRLYEKAGFKKIAVQKNFYENPAEDAWLMELKVLRDIVE
ncbi:MAG: ribosomal protein S18-alanine N-acetyltransferase [Clostridiales bacterium]|nr:ribosomal protein S18-alanine N-acetyltransferase [Clostridiales bacterium]